MEQRMVAVLFAEVVHPTALSSWLGPTAAERQAIAGIDDLGGLIAQREGEIVNVLGEAVMAVFGLASDALAVAAAAQRLFEAPGGTGVGPRLRVGVSVGQVTAGEGGYRGSAADEAVRLCQAARPGQVLCASVVRTLVGSGTGHVFEPVEALSLKGRSGPLDADQLVWAPPERCELRVVLADDAVILRQGLARLLREEGFRVVGEAGDADELLRLVSELVPDVVVTDIRMPPRMGLDGLEAALEIRRLLPDIGIMVLSQHIEAEYALRLLGDDATGVGYLLKERITAVDAFAVALRRVAAGGTAVDPEVVQALLHRPGSVDPLAGLSEREVGVLSLMAEGMSNGAIAERLFVSPRTVESHVASIFTKLDLWPESRDERRVVAVVRYLQARP